ncbi:MAG: DUF89 family protein [Desulfurococcales archaeon]|nr:DUF89 family protein [Desulfurococcales archaeon]
MREIVASYSGEEAIEKLIMLLQKSIEVYREDTEITHTAWRLFNYTLEIAPGVKDYYTRLRSEVIEEGLKRLQIYKSFIERFNGYKKFWIAVKIAIAGNALDAGVAGYEPPKSIDPETILSTPFSIDHTREVYNLVRDGGLTILYLFDNAGEAVLDTILAGILRDMDNHVIGVAKDEPGFQNDLTYMDAVRYRLDKYFDEIISTGTNTPSIYQNMVSREYLRRQEEADLVIAKGMAHYEYITDIDLGKPVLFLLTPKCNVIARHTGSKKLTYVALLRQ